MKRMRTPLAATLMAWSCLTAGLVSPFPTHAGPPPTAAHAQSAETTVAAANAFLETLDEATRGKAVFAFDDATQRKRWSNLPTGIFQRAGLKLGGLTKPQREAALKVLSAALSPAGYQKVLNIMEGDELLKKGNTGGKIVFGRDEYYISFLGAPSTLMPWQIQFGGHHLALNITLMAEKATLAPSHTAAQPASFTLDGKTIRPLGEENDLAFALINALDPTQKKQAILGAQFLDLVMGPGQEGKQIVPEGVKVSTFSTRQRFLLMSLIRQWVEIIRDDAAKARMEEIQSKLSDTWFAWSGPTTPGSAAYFRIQGPTLFIEYAPQKLGGDATQHIHTMYRDPSNEFGAKWLKP